MELLLLVFFCLLTGSEVTFGAEKTFIRVDEGSDVILPCSLREDITEKKFEWKKDGRQVFLYDDRDHSNIVITGQDRQFIQRVEHFPDKLKSGNASITIRDTMVADSGNYTCEFPDLQPRQIFSVKLIVFVKAPPPYVRILEQRGKSAVLQCEVRGAFPKPELHWEGIEGHKLPAEKQESERRGLYNIILQTTVTKTGIYRCVVTQKEINYQTHDETYVSVPVLTPGEIAAIVIAVGFVLYVLAVCIIIFFLNVKAPQPSVRILKRRDKSAELQCEVRGAFPKPELHWEDGDGNKLPAAEPQVARRGLLYDIILNTTVTKTDCYRCVSKQKKTNHQADAYIHVHIPGTTVVRVEEGSDVILPCLLREDITNKKFEWKKDGRQVFLYDDGTVNDNNSKTQDQQFKGRVRHLPGELKSGNASIIIRDTKVTDRGDYTCEFPDEPEQIFLIHVVVEPEVIRVEERKDATLSCLLRTEDITNKKFVWKKDGRQVFLYDKGTVNDNNSKTQDHQFRGRVRHLPDKLKSGDASIIIKDTRADDTGVYTCIFSDQPEQIFHIKLVFEPAAPTASGKGPAQDRKKTEPAAPTASGKGSAKDPKKTDGRDVDEAGSPFLNEDSRV